MSTLVRPLAIAVLAALFARSAAAAKEFDPNHLFVVCLSPTARIVELDEKGAKVREFTTDDDDFADAFGIGFSADGKLLATAEGEAQVYRWNAAGEEQTPLGKDAGLGTPYGLAIGLNGNVYVVSGTSRIVALGEDGNYSGAFNLGSVLPADVAVGPQGHLFVTYYGSDTIAELDPSGVLVNEYGAGSGLDGPWALAFGPSGRLYVAAHDSKKIFEFDSGGFKVNEFAAGTPDLYGIAVGPNGHVYAASHSGDRVLEFDPATGEKVREFGPESGIDDPTAIAFAPAVLRADLTGRVERFGEPSQKVTIANAALRFFAGEQTAYLCLPQQGDDAQALDLAFGSRTHAFHGFGAQADPSDKKRSFAGMYAADSKNKVGFGSLRLALKGKLGAADGAFIPTHASGRLVLASAYGGVFDLAIQAEP